MVLKVFTITQKCIVKSVVLKVTYQNKYDANTKIRIRTTKNRNTQ
jgi:hypothetical protein